MRLFEAKAGIIERRCLYGVSGPSRCFWRRRILAFLLYDTSIMLREEGLPADLTFILKSIALWPFPCDGMPMRRYKVAGSWRSSIFSGASPDKQFSLLGSLDIKGVFSVDD